MAERADVNRLALLLMAEWERVEGKPVTPSYVATFADMARAVLAAGYASPARHDADIAAAKAAGAAEVVARVEAVLSGDALWSPLKKALNKPEHAGATLNSIYAVRVILNAVADLLIADLRAALTTGGEG